MRELLRELTATPGISGHEDQIARQITTLLSPHTDEISIDPLANVIARVGRGPQKIAICAHLDTIGLMIKRQNADGSFGVVPVGGANLKSLPATRVHIHADDGVVEGVIGVRSQHQSTGSDNAVNNADELYLYAGKTPLEIGTPVTYAPQFVELSGGVIASPALDNRAGCAVMIDIARRLTDQHKAEYTIYFVGSAQEETTCAGIQTAVSAIKPDAALVIDGSLSYDTPETRGKGSVALGHGVDLVSFLYVSGLNGWHANPKLHAHLKRTAADGTIPVQLDVAHGIMTDARAVALLGVPTALLGLPMRGKHSPLEMVALADLESAVSLTLAALQNPLPDLSRG